MGKFETKGQIASLFLGAAGVAIILILLVNAEARKRGLLLEEEEKEVISDNTMKRGLYEKHFERTGRRKRSIANDNQAYELPSISENILEEALDGNKIRHIEDKVRYLGKDNYLVKAILQVYANNTTDDDNSTQEDTDNIDDVNKYLEDNDEPREDELATEKKESVSKDKTEDLKADFDNPDKHNSEYGDSEHQDNTEHIHSVHQDNAEHEHGVTDHKDTAEHKHGDFDYQDNAEHEHGDFDDKDNAEHKHGDSDHQDKAEHEHGDSDNKDNAEHSDSKHQVHSPLLEENVFEDMHSALRSATSDCSANGGLYIVVVITTIINISITILLLASARLYRFYKRRNNNPQDKIWLCQEDEISKYYEEGIEPRLGPIVIT
jgi:hypothetical protein